MASGLHSQHERRLEKLVPTSEGSSTSTSTMLEKINPTILWQINQPTYLEQCLRQLSEKLCEPGEIIQSNMIIKAFQNFQSLFQKENEMRDKERD